MDYLTHAYGGDRALMAAEVEQASADTGRGGSPPRFRTGTKVWLVLAAVAFSAITAELFGRRYTFFDMRIYHGAIEWWTSGSELYEFIAPNTELGFTYPPFGAVTMLPMVVTSSTVAGWLNIAASVAALAVILAMLLAPIADRLGWPRWLAVTMAVPLALALEPGRETLGFGQVNLLLFGLVFADLIALRWRVHPPVALTRTARLLSGPVGDVLRRFWFSGAWAGAGIGLATAIKITPGLFIVYLVVSRQWRAAMVATGTAIGATLAAAVVAPRETWAYFTSVLWQTDRVGDASFTPNQSLAGILARLYDQTDAPTLLWLSFAAVCCALGLSRAVAAHRDGDELASFTLVGLTTIVISPISWSHHIVYVIPAILIMGDAALRRRTASRGLGVGSALPGLRYAAAAVATYLLFLMAPIWWVRHHGASDVSHFDSGLWGVLAENSLALGVIMLLAAMPWRMGAEPTFAGRAAGARRALAG